MDGMPLTEEQIATFYPKDNLREILDELVDMGYLTLEYPRKRVNNRRIQMKPNQRI